MMVHCKVIKEGRMRNFSYRIVLQSNSFLFV